MTTFKRDRFTWLAYFMLAFYAYMLSALGPLMPFLRTELNLSYSVGALHPSAFALGMILAGLTGSALAERWGRALLFWGGGAGLAVGSLLLVSGRIPELTILGAFVMGFIGSYLVVMVPATLSDRHGSKRAIALTESNVAASISSAFVPVVIGASETIGLGWRTSLVLGVAAFVLLFAIFRRVPLPAGERKAEGKISRPLPRRFWAYWLVILLGVALEWCVGFWGADFLVTVVGLEKVTAASLMSVFFVAMVIGRLIGSRLTHTIESRQLLVYAMAVVGAGFPLFWLAQVPVLNVLGLFLAGLGIANLFPLTLSVATSIDPEQSNRASARVSMASGIAILLAPQVLASFADQVGLFNAFGVAAALLVAGGLIVFAESRYVSANASATADR